MVVFKKTINIVLNITTPNNLWEKIYINLLSFY